MTLKKLVVLTFLSIFATVFLASIVILSEPPAFIAYSFGALNGANWTILLTLFFSYGGNS